MLKTYFHLRGIAIEGISTSGKTSLFKAIKKEHTARNQERSFLALGEHYSQVLHNKEGILERSSVDDHVKLLKSKIDFLVNLGEWGDSLGDASIQSRGVFYVFDRFLLNHKVAFPESTISDLETMFLKCNPKTILLLISPDKIRERIKMRETGLSAKDLDRLAENYIREQERYIELSRISNIPTSEIKTDGMNWDGFARRAMDFVFTE